MVEFDRGKLIAHLVIGDFPDNYADAIVFGLTFEAGRQVHGIPEN